MNRSLQAALDFAPPGHFYSPHPDLEAIEADATRLFGQSSAENLPGINLNVAGQQELIARLSQFYGELPWGDEPQANLRYQYDNNLFCHGDVIALYGMMRLFRPRRIIEIGSGFSTAAMLDVNERFLGGDCALTCIEPFPDRLRSRLRPGDEEKLTILERNLQDVPETIFESLEANDFFFVDSSHVSKIGSDVNRIIFQLLPSLRPGVIVHFHDILYPFEYPKDWVLAGRAWNEAYLLRAFLQYNHAFQILFFNSYLHHLPNRATIGIAARLPLTARNPGGSLWLTRTQVSEEEFRGRSPAALHVQADEVNEVSSVQFESVGWSRISIKEDDLDAVETTLVAAGVHVQPLDLAPTAPGFARFVQLSAYASEYKFYGGDSEHCRLEKALEHYVSFDLIRPKAGMVGVDVGSCRSVAPQLLRERYGCRCYEQDLAYAPGVRGDQIGSSADAIPLPDSSVDFMTLHCTFEHFEGNADTGFVFECARLLKPGGQVVVLPLYVNLTFCNVTGEIDPRTRANIGFDPNAAQRCLIPEWHNRFGRHYSPAALIERVICPAEQIGLRYTLHRVENWPVIHPQLWLRWIIVLRKY